jgi:hypothetical protein
MNRRLVTAYIAVCVLLLVAPACTTAPPAPEIDPKGEITGIELEKGCTVQFQILMSQDPTTGATGARVDGGGMVSSDGRLDLPDLKQFDLSKKLTIEVRVIAGNCAPFIPPATWRFEGVLPSSGAGKYNAPYSQFKKIK